MNARFLMHFDSPRRRARRALFGLTVIGIGTLALLDNLQVFAIPLLRTFWPLAFVVWGLGRLVLPRHGGSRLFGLVLVAVGALMTAHNLGHTLLDLRQWWPVFIILGGVAIVLRGLFPGPRRWPQGAACATAELDHADEVAIDATFSGLKLRNDSRAFRGGRVEANFAGVELDLRDAAMTAPEAVLDLRGNFSGMEIRIPRDWQVVVQMTARLGAVEDKTVPPVAPAHRLVLRGETVFGGVEIKN